ncbi:FAD/NAD(P)-binding protein [Streptomyces sp. NBC_01217]|uniref:FAD/NAD(P)-binding protein n=1 Tax=Streptomyces sp. NBC_01217 TaxID=2903779 RepID=UPI002E164316|nr:FAD/NAD(P)-binding protein [Streptomyces sp. NBC_01217]
MAEISVAVIGAGPRGLSVVERLCANAPVVAGDARCVIHVIDPYPAGAGRVWRTDQSGELLMNTVASQITIFPDASVGCEGPILEGPSLYEWAGFLVLMEWLDDIPADVLREAERLGPNTYPSRAFYGHYLRWAFRFVCHTAPPGVSLDVRRATAVAITDRDDGRQDIVLDDGEPITGVDAVIMAQGHCDMDPGAEVRGLAGHARKHRRVYIPPANPADVDLRAIGAGDLVALRGLGLNFFDYMALLTSGRGGSFHPWNGRLLYEPSGEEPRLLAGSRRGIPYHARGENEKGVSERHEPLFLTPDVLAALRKAADAGAPAHFRQQVWPLVTKEVESVYYAALLTERSRPGTAVDFLSRYAKTVLAGGGESDEDRLLREFGLGPEDRWDWESVNRPYSPGSFSGIAGFNAWLLDYLPRDVAHAARGNVSDPVKSALDVLRDLRNEIRLVVDHGGISGSSYRADLDAWYTPMNAFLSIGPPVGRIQEMIALIEAGVLLLVGPGMSVTADADSGRFGIGSELTGDRPILVDALVEARLPDADIRHTRDPLVRSMLTRGQCRPYVIADPAGPGYRTGGLAVSPAPYHVLDVRGRPHPARFAYGVPTEHVHWVTAAGVRPGVNSVILGDSDAMARAALSVRGPQGSAAAGSPRSFAAQERNRSS